VGSLSVIAMILLLGTQATTGLFVESDDFFEYGPLVAYVSSDVVGRMTWIHRLVADGILIIVVLHVSAIIFYLCWKKENLIKPMLTGWKWVKSQR
jgi:cytochrome b